MSNNLIFNKGKEMINKKGKNEIIYFKIFLQKQIGDVPIRQKIIFIRFFLFKIVIKKRESVVCRRGGIKSFEIISIFDKF